MNKSILIATYIALLWTAAMPQASINPLSKIVITSNRATCQKDQADPNFFIFNYHENVVITFADKSTITADSLEVVFEGQSLGKKIVPAQKTRTKKTQQTIAKQSPMEKFKRITLSGNVTLINQNRKAQANKAELYLNEHRCMFTGNVIIQQQKTTAKEIPIKIESEQATLDLQTDEVLFTGSAINPVNTVISLEGYEPLQKKQKKRKHK